MRTELLEAPRDVRRDNRSQVYDIPDQTDLTNIVDGVVASEHMKKTLVSPGIIERSGKDIEPNRLFRSLPDGITPEDFVGIVKLAMYTEAGTDMYGDIIEGAAKRNGQLYGVKFINDFWRPDEYKHKEGYRPILNKVGVSDEEIDREIGEMEERGFKYGEDHTFIEATTFGIPQENLTGNFHRLIGKMLKESAPASAAMAEAVAVREYLHEALYKQLTAGQLAQNPLLLSQVAWSLADFRLPGNSHLPDLQPQARRWLPLMGSNVDQIKRELVGGLYHVVKDVDTAGLLAMEYMVIKGVETPIVSPKLIQDMADFVLDKVGQNWSHQFFGEALLESVDIDFPLKDKQGLLGFVKNRLRTMVANKFKAVPLVA